MSGTWRDGSNDIGAESCSNTVLELIESAFFCIVIWKGVRALCNAVITIRSQLGTLKGGQTDDPHSACARKSYRVEVCSV
jgi:hypothetical protein